MKTSHLLLVLFLLPALAGQGQKLSLKSYSAGIRLIETPHISFRPTHVATLLKNGSAYHDFIRTFTFNGLSSGGTTSGLFVKNIYVNTTWHNLQATTRFWQKAEWQGGLWVANMLRNTGQVMTNNGIQYSGSDTVLYQHRYMLTQHAQLAGLNIGINRHGYIAKHLTYTYGVHLKGGTSLKHYFQHQADSTWVRYPGGIRHTASTTYPQWEGKRLYQWQAMVPLALELNLYRNKFTLRTEFIIGTVGGRFRTNHNYIREAHGFGFWLLYHPSQQ